jgi:hypothetical protein
MIAPGLRLNTRKGCTSERPMETPDLPAPQGGRGPRRFHMVGRVLRHGRFAPIDLEHQPALFSRLLSEEMNLRSLPTWTYRTHLRDVHATRNRSCGTETERPPGTPFSRSRCPAHRHWPGPDIRKRPASQKRLGARRNRRMSPVPRRRWGPILRLICASDRRRAWKPDTRVLEAEWEYQLPDGSRLGRTRRTGCTSQMTRG